MTCPFCDLSALTIIAQNDLAYAIYDHRPVKPLHALIIPKQHSTDIFETTPQEREALHQLAQRVRADIMDQDPTVQGVNYGSNVGSVAGQKVFHTHIHLIPRRAGDLDPPPAKPD